MVEGANPNVEPKPATQRRRRRRNRKKGKPAIVKVTVPLHAIPDGGGNNIQTLHAGANGTLMRWAESNNGLNRLSSTKRCLIVKPPLDWRHQKMTNQVSVANGVAVRLTSMVVEITNLAPPNSSAMIEVFENLRAPIAGVNYDSPAYNALTMLRTLRPGEKQRFDISLEKSRFNTRKASGLIQNNAAHTVATLRGDRAHTRFNFTRYDIANVDASVPACGVALRLNGGWNALIAGKPDMDAFTVAQVEWKNVQFMVS